jgi:hypothetical protein
MNRVEVVPVDQPERARALAAGGSAVVVVGRDGKAVGELVADLVLGGARAAGFVGDADDSTDAGAIAELIDELFAERG